MLPVLLRKLHLRPILKTTGFIFTFLITTSAFGQWYVTNYAFLGVGIGTESNKPINLELRLSTNNKLVNTLFEVVGLYHLNDSPYHSISAGLGLNLDLLAEADLSVVLPVELEVFPAPSFKRIALAFEIGPEFQLAFDQVNLRHLWAIRYYFSEPD